MELNKIFTSHMVFAAHKPIKIYGSGKGRAEISFAGEKTVCMSDSENWSIELPPMEYGGPYSMSVILENRSLILEDIYIGDVFLFAGQSNVDFKVGESTLPRESYKSNDMLRIFSADNKTDKFTSDDGWVICKKEEVEYWSALAYSVGDEIAKKKDVAVGCIVCYQGASAIESWVPKGTFSDIVIQEPKPDHTSGQYGSWNFDGFLYENSLSKVIPYNLSAVVWYQGETDTYETEGLVYADELCRLIEVWRKDFYDEDLPFVIIQIADFIERNDRGWQLVQEAQMKVQLMMKNTKTVVSRDVCENDEIHPKTKDKLAKRVSGVILNDISL